MALPQEIEDEDHAEGEGEVENVEYIPKATRKKKRRILLKVKNQVL